MLTPTLRKWTELSASEKVDIISTILSIKNPWERDKIRKSLAEKYRVSEWTITSFIAHETMRRMKSWEWNHENPQAWVVNRVRTEGEWVSENPIQWIQESTQSRVYTITTLSELTEDLRKIYLKSFEI